MEFTEDPSCFAAFRRAKKRSAEPERLFLHNFGDGRGPVTAYQHKNLDGRLGGIVEYGTTFVHPEARIDEGAVVYGHAHISKNVWMLPHSTARDDAVLKGALILGSLVEFSGIANCTIKPQVRHPVYIGAHPFHFPNQSIDERGTHKHNYSNAPRIKCSQHPIVCRKIEKGVITTMTYTDDFVFTVKTPRGYSKIADFIDDMKPHLSPTGKDSLSWNPMRNTIRIAVRGEDIDYYPNVDDTEIRLLIADEDRSMRRVVKPLPPWQPPTATPRW